ncbi:amino acid adenylation domain-containing protein [Clostridium tagluense]|uniref:non-ribosomal peptide synthetase n=1 Tax=Clostridium tagluense TaxID=360422 RepID=UPI001CF49250|nr:non-ribosomal peptide synthetase [Clostridium tagluense]MCB2312203.1 amino acid adenylation domain-containing protein [Clostridium tagluense]MCB2316790.1 amino acid adenylation domain-containing protein [Clostridium tagluense]MCB2321650.1 amino acid adenylation domain-containing protein [Clostridium tagluense]MCB2326659.1 amino acid adenylation domain-containing protein [Clostridium tagluense]MCB2331382.1 amino acid adenylation domain-containing protein [Clostridium tagluense]
MININKKHEITHPQKRIWYNELLFPHTSMHNIVRKINIDKKINILLLEKAINLIIEKNDSLRLNFCENNGQPYQYVKPYEFVDIPFLDFSHYDDKDIEKKFKEFCEIESKKNLYEENKLLFKFFIYKINDEKMGLFFVIHHIILDGMSINLILRQINDICEKLNKGELITNNVENSYIDFVNYEKKYLASDEFVKNKHFWNEKFSNLNENSLYVNSKNIQGKIKRFILKNDTSKKLKIFLNEHKISLNRFLISVSAIYINKILEEKDITLAVATFNRSNEGQKNTMGMFTGTMPLRINIANNISYDEFLNSINTELNSCYSNQKYPYDLLVQDLKLKKKGFDSLFKLCVNYYVFDSGSTSKISIENEVFPQDSLNVPLHILAKEFVKNEDIEFEINYRIKDYTEKEIMTMFQCMEIIINQIIINSNIKLSEIQIISKEDKIKILKEFNNTEMDYPKHKTVKELFEETSITLEEKIAIVSNGNHLTYKELNERANQIANLLRKKGIIRNTIVPILCDRSAETIIGILGIIKSGGAYLPIDEDYPEARIQYMIEDSSSKILLIKKHHLGKAIFAKTNIELLDLNSEKTFKESKQNLENINSPEDLAYLIYTSGSTGNPKGVCIENRGLVNLAYKPSYIELQKHDKILQSGSLSFDASVFQVWIALLNGVTLHLEDENLMIDDDALENYISKNEITMMLMPTPLFNQYSRNNIELFKNLKGLIVGGDVLSSKQVSKITRTYKNLKIFNAYGPTENSVISTIYEVVGEWDENKVVPIGKSISNSTAYIMNKNNNLLPIGVSGELCLGGDGIAKEYLNREKLTKEKFIENPYVKGKIIYKTGDIARRLPDGNIDFIGRMDHQVKIRGFRIELEEIEAQLLKHSKLKEATVVDKDDENGNKYLCGYFVSEETISSKELKEFLKKELPLYMIPSYITQLEKMPINCNGKVDRKALPLPILSQSNVEFIKPRNEMEEKLVNIWCKIFNTKKISIKDNFFELGGHSLIAVNLVSKINKEIKLKISASDIFAMPCIEELAEYLNEMAVKPKDFFENSNNSNFKGIEKADETDYYEASAVQKRMYAVNQMDIGSTNYNMTFAYLIKGQFDKCRFEKALCELINRHEALRTSFHIIKGDVFQKIDDTVDLKVECTKTNENFDINECDTYKFLKPFDLSKSPLIRATIVEFCDVVMLTIDMHHIISDGVSIGIIIKELSALYNGEKLENTKVQYKDFSNWQNKSYENGLLGTQEKYWTDKFRGELPVVNISSNYKKRSTGNFEGTSLKFGIDKTISSGINKIINSLGVTKFMFYTAAYNVLLYKYSGQEDLIIGTPVAGRTHEDLKNTVGMFVNTLPLRNKLNANMNFRNFLSEVKLNSLKAFENQDYDLKNIIEKLEINKSSIFDMIFSFQNLAIDALNFENTEIASYEVKNKTSKFDISMILKENNEKVSGVIEYQTSLYNKKTMKNFAKHYQNILREVVNALDTPIGKIDILSKNEKDLIINKFNDTKRQYLNNITIKELFEQIVAKSQEKVALVSNGKELTYRELNEKANQLAHLLRDKGVTTDSIVPVICDRSIVAIISMIAVIKAGGAYLPVDEEYPESRIKYMLCDCNCSIVIGKEEHFENFNLYELNLELIKFQSEEIQKESLMNLETINTYKDLAYVIYTSGSTGKPKGVCIENRSLIKVVNNPNYIEIQEYDKILQSGSLSFDASVFQIWIALLNGASLHVENKTLIIDEAALETYINENKITIMLMPTPLFNQYSQNNIELFKNLRYLLVGGDVLSSKQVSKITKVYKSLNLLNAYGPTENSVISTVYEVVGEWDENKAVPIGKPVSNSTAYIIDKNNKLLPMGVPGELCVGGDGVAREYLNRKELTKDKFIENPYVKGEKIYKTGDLAKWLPDGNIDFMGRIDYQVKIRGFRVELGEIEAQLLKHSKIKKVSVVDKMDENGNKYLCGYIVSEEKISSKELKAFLKKELPLYMIPSYIMQLENMPINLNGKVDKKALPIPDLSNIDAEYIAPRNDIDEKISIVWSEILGIKKISINSNFFDVGGNSLKAISVVSKLSKEFIIAINDIFKYPTIQELASNIKNKEEKLLLKNKEVQDMIAVMKLDEDDNVMPQSIKLIYDSYIEDIQKYEKLNLNSEISYKNILLTGATGYVGINILKELIFSTNSTIHLLLRGINTMEAEKRITLKTDFYFGKEFYLRYKHRINILTGNISDEYLGMDNYTYDKLCMEIDCIINSAANVKHYGKYEDSYNVNVLGTKRLLEFAKKGVRKDFNQISTMSVAYGSIPNTNLVMFSESNIDIGQECDNVYVRTKLEAEKLVEQAGKNLLNTKIFRVGNVTFNYETGLFQENINENAFYQNIKSFIKLNCVPNIKGNTLDFCFVDQLSKAIVLLFNKNNLNNEAFHLENPNKVSTSYLAQVLKIKYENIKLKDIEEFLACISSKGEDEELREYVDNIMVHFGLLDNDQLTSFITVSERTDFILKKLAFEWGKLDELAIKKMLEHCEKVKFL